MNDSMAFSRTESDARWAAVVARDAAADGAFFYAVTTTGVYCRPSCGARRPRPENVRFLDNAKAAARAGFRPCKRCKPDQASDAARRAQLITRACRIIDESETPLANAKLARAVGLSPAHFQRLFKDTTGVTPGEYATAKREGRLRAGLKSARTVTEAIYDAGYNAPSRFYERADRVLGMRTAEARKGGAETTIRYGTGRCSLGLVLAAQSTRGICAILLGDDAGKMVRELRERFPKAEVEAGDKAFAAVVKQVVAFVDEPGRGLDLPLDIRGTAFQKRVWKALQDIPCGETLTFAEIAKRIGKPKAVRAVGSACGANAIGVAIPCHRALRTDGGLGGYYWGLPRKRGLLKKEFG